MSRTIVTNSGTDFFTNISSEKLIGKLCKMVSAKHHSYQFTSDYIELSMAYDMTAEEAQDTADKLRGLLDQNFFDEVKIHFKEGSTNDALRAFIISTAEDFEKSKGYECLG
jgi:hypothetical protein